MPRPRKCRYIETAAAGQCFKPCASGHASKNAVTLFLDELEAIRLGDLEGLSQEDAAAKMEISRSTFARTIDAAHRKIAEALVSSKPIAIEGEATDDEKRKFKCEGCGRKWATESGPECPKECPKCGGKDFHRTNCGRRYQRQSSGGDRCCDRDKD